MTLTGRIFVAGLSAILFLVVLRMSRRRALGLEYSILWLLLTGFAVVAAFWTEKADALSRLVGIDYPPAFFFFVCIIVLLFIVLHLTVRLSRLSAAMRTLAQEIALLRTGGGDSGAAGAPGTAMPRAAASAMATGGAVPPRPEGGAL
ncbi:MAG: DUF2304 domain-containing protein [Candidatus Eisenbacteria bacterium]